MANGERQLHSPGDSPPLLPEPRRQPLSAVGRQTWQLSWVIFSGTLLSLIVHRLLGPGASIGLVLVLLFSGTAWAAALRMLFLDTAAKRFWLIWLAIGAVLLFVLGPGGTARYVALLFAGVFLVFRKYRPYRQLATTHRAVVFFMGILGLATASVGWDFTQTVYQQNQGAAGLAATLAQAAIGFLRIFWGISLLSLFFGMRLRGFRLRTKLAVSSVFLAVIPIALLLIFGLMFTYGALGGSRAARASKVFASWSQTLQAGGPLASAPFAHRLQATHVEGAWTVNGEAPAWLPELATQLNRPAAEGDNGSASSNAPGHPGGAEAAAGQDSAARRDDPDARPGTRITLGQSASSLHGTDWAPVDTTAYFHVGEEVWLLNLAGIQTDTLRVRGYRIDEAVLDHLSELLMCNVGLYSNPDLVVVAGRDTLHAPAARADSARAVLSIDGQFKSLDNEFAKRLGFLGKPLGFGAGLQGVFRLGPAGFYRDNFLFHLKVSLYGLSLEFLREDYRLNQALLGGLVFAAVLLLLVQGFAVFLGIRITTGITSAVNSLHRGTVRLAKGDLNTRVEVPNQDEFGDLAYSFNEMAEAVRHGQDEAVKRERLERELETAREIQARLLPDETPLVPGFEITGTSLPSRQVGGDYFDFLQLGENRVGVAIGDVSGKGIPAALLMSNLQACLQGQVIHPSSVAETVARINDLLSNSTDSQMFATFCYGLLDFAQATFTVTNAGHNPPILCRMNGSIEKMESGGLLIGMMPGLVYQQETVEFRPGDVLVLYTDGVTEAEGPFEIQEGGQVPRSEEEEGEVFENMFGEARLIDTIQEHAHASAMEIREAVLEAVTRHAAGVPQSDDVTLVVIKRKGTVSELTAVT